MPFYHPIKSYKDDPDYPDKADWIARRLLALRYDLSQALTKDRRPNSLIIGSWNVRAFDGGLPRLDESYHYIAEIISAFDVCALQELKPDLAPLTRLMRLLGPTWDYFVTDVSTQKGGNSERMAFVYNTNRVFFRNIIGEVVIGRDVLPTGDEIARSPFFAAFQAGWFRFTLCGAHIIFGEDETLRAAEITAITDALAKRAKVEDQVFVFLGDMNIPSADSAPMKALEDSKMELATVPPSSLDGKKPYDQIAFTVEGASTRKTRLIRSGGFDWRNAVFGPSVPADPNAPDDPEGVTRLTDDEQRAHYEPIVTAHRAKFGKEPYANFKSSYRGWMTHEMSDHLPVWAELEVDYSDEYLARFLKD